MSMNTGLDCFVAALLDINIALDNGSIFLNSSYSSPQAFSMTLIIPQFIMHHLLYPKYSQNKICCFSATSSTSRPLGLSACTVHVNIQFKTAEGIFGNMYITQVNIATTIYIILWSPVLRTICPYIVHKNRTSCPCCYRFYYFSLQSIIVWVTTGKNYKPFFHK